MKKTGMHFSIVTSCRKPVGIVAFSELLDVQNSAELQQQFGSWIRETNLIVMDFKQTEFIDSTGLGTVISCLRKVLELGGDVRLAGLGPKVAMVFELTKVNTLFTLFPDAASAVESFSKDGRTQPDTSIE